ncbi:MAG: metallophosphoesterase, partial [Flavobacteriales bacterium]
MRFQKYLFTVLFLLILVSCKTEQQAIEKNERIAFIADAHLSDIFGTFQDNDYKGIPNPVTGEYANIRT